MTLEIIKVQVVYFQSGEIKCDEYGNLTTSLSSAATSFSATVRMQHLVNTTRIPTGPKKDAVKQVLHNVRRTNMYKVGDTKDT